MGPLVAALPALAAAAGSMGTVAAVATAVSGVVGAVGSVIQGRNQAAIAKGNARALEVEAQNREIAASIQGERQRRQARAQMGAQRAGAAQSGALSGTTLDLLDENSVALEMDALTVEYQGRVDADQSRTRAALQRADAKSYMSAGIMSGIGKGIGAIGSFAGGFDGLAGPGGGGGGATRAASSGSKV